MVSVSLIPRRRQNKRLSRITYLILICMSDVSLFHPNGGVYAFAPIANSKQASMFFLKRERDSICVTEMRNNNGRQRCRLPWSKNNTCSFFRRTFREASLLRVGRAQDRSRRRWTSSTIQPKHFFFKMIRFTLPLIITILFSFILSSQPSFATIYRSSSSPSSPTIFLASPLGSFKILPSRAELELVFRLLYAALVGAAVGIERHSSDRPAGIRTMALVSLGACIFTLCSIYGFGSHAPLFGNDCKVDPSRMAANVASGVGFIGAGVITQNRKPSGVYDVESSVRGLTTASAIWIAAAVGVAAGVGLYFVSGVATLATIAILCFGRMKKKTSELGQRVFSVSTKNKKQSKKPQDTSSSTTTPSEIVNATTTTIVTNATQPIQNTTTVTEPKKTKKKDKTTSETTQPIHNTTTITEPKKSKKKDKTTSETTPPPKPSADPKVVVVTQNKDEFVNVSPNFEMTDIEQSPPPPPPPPAMVADPFVEKYLWSKGDRSPFPPPETTKEEDGSTVKPTNDSKDLSESFTLGETEWSEVRKGSSSSVTKDKVKKETKKELQDVDLENGRPVVRERRSSSSSQRRNSQ